MHIEIYSRPSPAGLRWKGAVVFMPLTTAQRLFALHHRINAVHLVLNDGIDPGRLTADLHDHLPAGLTVQSPSAGSGHPFS